MLESKLEKRLADGVKKLGGQSYKFVSPGCTGVPDRMVIMPGGRIVFAELKTDDGVLSERQKYVIDGMRRMGAEVEVVRGETGVSWFLEKMRWLAEGAS